MRTPGDGTCDVCGLQRSIWGEPTCFECQEERLYCYCGGFGCDTCSPESMPPDTLDMTEDEVWELLMCAYPDAATREYL